MQSVFINNTLVDKSNYSVKNGSIIVSFNKDYVDSLKPGTYKITFNTAKGTANAELMVKEKSNTNVDKENTAKTGDQSALTVYALIAIAAIGIGYFVLRQKKSKK